MADLRLRPGESRDIHEIAVMSRCQVEIGLRGWTWHPARIARTLRSRDTCAVVAEIGDRFAGFLIAGFGDTQAHLSLLAVKPAWQRRGVGLAMIEWLIGSALTAGITHFDVEMRANNFAARSFYETLGFIRTGYIPGYYQNIEPAVRMRRDIRLHGRQPVLPATHLKTTRN